MSEKRTKDHKALKESYRSAHREVSELIREADPMQLISAGAPADEYDPEVSTILARLQNAQSVDDVQRIVHEVFVQWFSPDIAGPASNYSDLSKKIWTWSTRASAFKREP